VSECLECRQLLYGEKKLSVLEMRSAMLFKSLAGSCARGLVEVAGGHYSEVRDAAGPWAVNKGAIT